MAGDIEEFLRRAAQRRAQQQNQPQKPPAQPRPQPQRRPLVQEVEVVDEVEIVEPEILSGSSVADHVADHMRSGVFDERLSHLGEVVDASDDRMEEHLHEVFEHDLGQLGTKTARAADSTLDDDSPGQQPIPTVPVDYLKLLQDPESIRRAIILNEILSPPTDRW